MNFTSHFEELSKLKVKETDNLDDVLERLGEKLCMCLSVERVNVWVFKINPNRIECIGNFINFTKKFSKGEVLLENQIPSYFNHLESDKVIRIKNVYKSDITHELKDSYCVDNHIFAIMDVPVRIQGDLAGVICFEDCKSERNWSDEEKNFALAVSQIVSLAIENQKRKNIQKKLEKALEEKNTLFTEMHHRLKNNLTMLVSLLRLQTSTITDEKTKEILANFENQLLSISRLHEQLYVSGDFTQFNLKNYLSQLLNNFGLNESKNKIISFYLDEVMVDTQQAVIIGLIVNEIISNALKHANNIEGNLKIACDLRNSNNKISLQITDNGKGFDLNQAISNSFGLKLIYELSEQLDAKIDFISNSTGTSYKIEF